MPAERRSFKDEIEPLIYWDATFTIAFFVMELLSIPVYLIGLWINLRFVTDYFCDETQLTTEFQRFSSHRKSEWDNNWGV